MSPLEDTPLGRHAQETGRSWLSSSAQAPHLFRRSMPITLPGLTLGATRCATSPFPVPHPAVFVFSARQRLPNGRHSLVWPPAQPVIEGAMRSKKSTRWSDHLVRGIRVLKAAGALQKTRSWALEPDPILLLLLGAPCYHASSSNPGSARPRSASLLRSQSLTTEYGRHDQPSGGFPDGPS